MQADIAIFVINRIRLIKLNEIISESNILHAKCQ